MAISRETAAAAKRDVATRSAVCSSQGAATAEAGPCQTVDTRQAQCAFRPPVDNSIVTERAVCSNYAMQPCSASHGSVSCQACSDAAVGHAPTIDTPPMHQPCRKPQLLLSHLTPPHAPASSSSRSTRARMPATRSSSRLAATRCSSCAWRLACAAEAEGKSGVWSVHKKLGGTALQACWRPNPGRNHTPC